jgi:hypothetical protein
MDLVKEAAYLYAYSKELKKVNKEIKKLSKKAQKHHHKHQTSTKTHKIEKHKSKYESTAKRIKTLLAYHKRLIKTINHHQLQFTHTLRKN